jgi:hypothetical protein
MIGAGQSLNLSEITLLPKTHREQAPIGRVELADSATAREQDAPWPGRFERQSGRPERRLRPGLTFLIR